MPWCRHPFSLGALAVVLTMSAAAQAGDAVPAALSPSASAGTASGPFIANSEQPFGVLMDDIMAHMHTDMMQAPRAGDADADFVAMMIPHHQGAIDMAKALLLHSKDPALRNLALQIVTEQQNEIKLMEAWRNSRRNADRKTPARK